MLQAVQLKLWSAAETGDAVELKRCLEAGADPRTTNRLGWNALHRACMSGNVDCVEPLLPADDEAARVAFLALPDGAGNLPIHIAAGCGHADVVKLLLRSGAKVDATTGEPKEGDSSTLDQPMHTACKALSEARERPKVESLLETVRVPLPPPSCTACVCSLVSDRRCLHCCVCLRALVQIVALIQGGGLLEAEDAKKRMAASYLTPPMVHILLARVRPSS